MAERKKYSAFISYRHLEPDSTIAAKLQALLESFRPPKGVPEGRRISRLFRDSTELPLSEDLGDAITTALKESEFLIVILSERTKESRWCMKEIRDFKAANGGRIDRILPVVVSGVPGDVLPPELRFDEESGEEKEPICADVRAGSIREAKKKLRTEFLRIAAPMLGCGFDDLYQRTRRRQQRRLIAASAAAFAVISGYALILTRSNYAISAKNEELNAANKKISLQNETLESANSRISSQNEELESANTRITEQNGQLDENNRKLREQQLELMRSESALLADAAVSSMQEGDYREALVLAAKALPLDAEDERPYCAEAEAVLNEALMTGRNLGGGLYEFSPVSSREILLSDSLEQETPVRCLQLSRDGKLIYTLDQYGAVRCFEIESGNLRWKTNLLFEYTGTFSPAVGFAYSAALDMLYVNYMPAEHTDYAGSEILTAIRCSDGSIAWDFPGAGDRVKCRNGQVILSGDGKWAAYAAEITSSPFTEVFFLDALSGALNKSFPLGRDGEYLRTGIVYLRETPAGVFSEENSGDFCGVYYVGGEEGEAWERRFYQVSLDRGEYREFYREEEEEQLWIRAMRYSLSDDTLTVAGDSGEDSRAAALMQINVGKGDLLWEQKTPETGKDTVWGAFKTSVIFDSSNGYVVIGREKRLYLYSLENGEYLAEYRSYQGEPRELSGSVETLFPVNPECFGFLLSDGTQGACWRAGEALSFSGCISDVGSNAGGAVWNGGIREMSEADGTRAYGYRGGFVLTVPDKESGRMVLTRHRTLYSPWEKQIIREETDYWDPYPMTEEEIAFTAGPSVSYAMARFNSGIKSREYRITVLDTGTMEKEEYLFRPGRELRDVKTPRFILSSDGLGMLVDAGNGSFCYHTFAAGETRLLRNGEAASGMEDAGAVPFERGTMNYSAKLSEDGAAFCAAVSGGSLHLWHDADGEEIPLPPGMQWDYTEEKVRHRMLSAGANGQVLLSDYSGADGINAVQRFAVFDTEEHRWVMVEDEAKGSDARLVSFAPDAPLLAVADNDNTIRIYDTEEGIPAGQAALPVPGSALRQLGFSRDGAYLYAVTEDDLILIYDAKDNNLVYSSVLLFSLDVSTGRKSPVELIHDSPRERLYIIGLHPVHYRGGLCLDTRSWTQTASMDSEVIAILPEEEYMLGMDYRTVYVTHIPDTSELADAARETARALEE